MQPPAGRTSAAMKWIVDALAILFAAVAARGLTVFGFSFACGTTPDCAAGPGAEVLFLAFGFAFVVIQIAGVLLFVYGFRILQAGRFEVGPDHARRVERAGLLLVLTAVIVLVEFIAHVLLIPFSPPGTPAREPVLSVLVGPIPNAVVSLLAGLVLLDLPRSFSIQSDRLILIAAVGLGVVGAVVEGFSLYPGSDVLPSSIVSLPFALNLASQAILATSLLLILLVYRRLHRKFRAGAFRPVRSPGYPPIAAVLPEAGARPPLSP